MSRIEEVLAALTRQLGALPATSPDSRTLPLAPLGLPATAVSGETVCSAPVARSSRSAVEAILLPDLARAEAGLRAFDLPGRRAAAVYLDGHGGQVYVYDQDGRPLHVEG